MTRNDKFTVSIHPSAKLHAASAAWLKVHHRQAQIILTYNSLSWTSWHTISYHIILYFFNLFYILYIYIFSSTMTSTYIYLHIYIKTCSRHHHSFHIIFDNIWLGVQNLQTFKAEERGSTQPRLPNRLLADYQHTGDQSVGDIYLPTNNHWMSSVTTCQVQRW